MFRKYDFLLYYNISFELTKSTMITNHSHNNQTWIDLHLPTKEEVDSLVATKHIDPIIAKDLISPTPKQYAKIYDDSIYLVIHIPYFRHTGDKSVEQEIDFIINKDNVITTRYESIDALHQVSREIDTESILHKNTGGHVFFRIAREIYSSLFDEIDYMRDWIKDIEKNIFEGKEKEMVFGISSASRNLLNFRRIVEPHKMVWEQLTKYSLVMYGESFKKEAKDLYDEWTRLHGEISNINDMIDELRNTNDSILSTKQNELMKTFTILAFVTFPLSLVAAVFGMNSDHMPIIGHPNDFWLIIGLMCGISLAMFAYFKYKKWI